MRTHPCQVWIISAQWETESAYLGCIVSLLLWLARLFTIPALLVYSMLWNYTWASSVAGAVVIIAGRERQDSERIGWYSAFLQRRIYYGFCYALSLIAGLRKVL